ncbi:AAA+ ATPase domain [Macleaya cordata]|uniref:AAA+ ATPase domain n=1 Tax=Macleaya cordata TaxID=56857 RepID=A0A200QCA5_MACCD|nr:AAA+ ATPase domain [Macleaya cordata]
MKMLRMADIWTEVGSSIASIMFLYTMFQRYFPHRLRVYITKYVNRILGYTDPYMEISIYEFTENLNQRNGAYTAIQTYLSSKSSKNAKRLKAQIGINNKKLVLSMEDNEVMTDEFQGAKLRWYISRTPRQTQSSSSYRAASDESRYLTLKFHQRYRDIVTGLYLNHVLEKGKAKLMRNRQRKLYTNNSRDDFWCKRALWSHVAFDHPATFDNLAMDPMKKKEIIDDLITFSKARDYYARVGKAWKRGYLLYGPPGTGKSTMIAAMANFLSYDVYDLELTAVRSNGELQKLLLETTNKSIIVIEDMDCSLSLTGRRKNKKDKEEDTEEKDKEEDQTRVEENRSSYDSKVTLSGLLNFIDGLWSSCRGERLIVFTTNYIEKLDPALIRRGRMDKHIELSYCDFEGFKILAKNYLNLDSHHLFENIRPLINETQMTPADVAENLMPKTINEDDSDICLKNLIQALEKRKEDTRLKNEERAKVNKLSSKDGEAIEGDSLTKDGEANEGDSLTKDGVANEGDSSTKGETNQEDESTGSNDKDTRN